MSHVSLTRTFTVSQTGCTKVWLSSPDNVKSKHDISMLPRLPSEAPKRRERFFFSNFTGNQTGGTVETKCRSRPPYPPTQTDVISIITWFCTDVCPVHFCSFWLSLQRERSTSEEARGNSRRTIRLRPPYPPTKTDIMSIIT